MADDFDLAQLLAGPIKALNDAQADVSARFADNLQQIAFKPLTDQQAKATTPAARELREIVFATHTGRVDATGKDIVQQISVPMLQLVPLSGLHVETAKLEYSCDVTASPAAPSVGAAKMNARGSGPAASAPIAATEPAAVRGAIAHTGGVPAGTRPGNLHIEINLQRTDLPSGLLDMLAATHSRGREAIPAEPATPIASTTLVAATLAKSPLLQFSPGREVPATLLLTFLPQSAKGKYTVALAVEPSADIVLVRPAPASIIAEAPAQRRISLLLYIPIASRRTKAPTVQLVVECDYLAVDGIHRHQQIKLPLQFLL